VRELGRKLGPSIEDARKAVRQWQSMSEGGHSIAPGNDGLAYIPHPSDMNILNYIPY